MVPLAKLGISNTPIGPFHKIVFDLSNTDLIFSRVLGPASNPSQPSGIAFTGTTCVLALLSKASAATTSIGKCTSTPLALALARISSARSSLSSSQIELPTFPPCALMKV